MDELFYHLEFLKSENLRLENENLSLSTEVNRLRRVITKLRGEINATTTDVYVLI